MSDGGSPPRALGAFCSSAEDEALRMRVNRPESSDCSTAGGWRGGARKLEDGGTDDDGALDFLYFLGFGCLGVTEGVSSSITTSVKYWGTPPDRWRPMSLRGPES